MLRYIENYRRSRKKALTNVTIPGLWFDYKSSSHFNGSAQQEFLLASHASQLGMHLEHECDYYFLMLMMRYSLVVVMH